MVVLNGIHPGAYLPKQFSWKVQPHTDEESYKLNDFDPNGTPDKWRKHPDEEHVSAEQQGEQHGQEQQEHATDETKA